MLTSRTMKLLVLHSISSLIEYWAQACLISRTAIHRLFPSISGYVKEICALKVFSIRQNNHKNCQIPCMTFRCIGGASRIVFLNLSCNACSLLRVRWEHDERKWLLCSTVAQFNSVMLGWYCELGAPTDIWYSAIHERKRHAKGESHLGKKGNDQKYFIEESRRVKERHRVGKNTPTKQYWIRINGDIIGSTGRIIFNSGVLQMWLNRGRTKLKVYKLSMQIVLEYRARKARLKAEQQQLWFC